MTEEPLQPSRRLDYQAIVDRLYQETETQGAKLMGLVVHPCISGVPHRIGWFEQALGYVAARPGTLFWQGRQILDWYPRATA